MGHYELLQVDPSASMAEIRNAYLRLARDSHPDFHHQSNDARLGAEKRMRKINEAWSVLGDVDERSAYDRDRLSAAGQRPKAPFHGATESHEAWHAFDDRPPEEFDDLDDRPITASALPRWLAMAPAALGLGGLGALVVGSMIGVVAIAGMGIISLVLSGLLFLAAPLVALSSSSRQDRGA